MKYTYPPGFDLPRALQLAGLVNCAYTQFLQPDAWKSPPGFVGLTPALSSKEYWKFGPLSEAIEQHLPTQIVPSSFGFTGTIGTDVFVVIRGTKTPLEWFDDFAAEPVPFLAAGQPWGKIGRGYKRIFDDLGPQIIQALGAYRHNGGSLDAVYVTGHSLGAALAHLAAATIAQEFGVKPITYTFSGPRAGDSVFGAATQGAGPGNLADVQHGGHRAHGAPGRHPDGDTQHGHARDDAAHAGAHQFCKADDGGLPARGSSHRGHLPPRRGGG